MDWHVARAQEVPQAKSRVVVVQQQFSICHLKLWHKNWVATFIYLIYRCHAATPPGKSRGKSHFVKSSDMNIHAHHIFVQQIKLLSGCGAAASKIYCTTSSRWWLQLAAEKYLQIGSFPQDKRGTTKTFQTTT